MRHLIIGSLTLFTIFAGQVDAANELLVQSSCGPKLLIQAPVPDRSYNGPTILEGDVYQKGVTVTVTVDGVSVPVTMVVMNPGATQFWRWSTPKVKTRGPHVAVITATSKTGGSTTVTSNFRVAVSGP